MNHKNEPHFRFLKKVNLLWYYKELDGTKNKHPSWHNYFEITL